MVPNRWNEAEAKSFLEAAGSREADRQLALRIYSARLIGADRDLVLHGGGNVSCKLTRTDVFGQPVEVLHVKGSGHDLGQIDAEGLPGLRLEPLRALRVLETLSDDDMVNIQRSALLDSTSPNPSIETQLHAFLPHRFIDHTHATAMLVLADHPDAPEIVGQIYGGRLAVVPFVKPGFDLARIAAEIYEKNPEAEGLLLRNHGHFAFGDSARESYDRLIEHTNMAERWIAGKAGSPASGVRGDESASMASRAEAILPLLRGAIGSRNAEFSGNTEAAMPVMSLRTGPRVQAFLAREDLADLAAKGIATPDHVIRTKNYPLHLTADILARGADAIAEAVNAYASRYEAYFAANNARYDGAKTQLAPTPNVAWAEGVGLVGIGADAGAASAAADLGEQNIDVMVAAQASGGFEPVSESDLFDMEYWALERIKVARPAPPALQGRVVMVTGGAGAIGLATARAFARQGADLFLVDLDQGALDKALDDLGSHHGGMAMDITRQGAAEDATKACIRAFGGLDILVSNAGAAWTGEMNDLPDETLRKSFELNFFSHRNFARAAALTFEAQKRGGQILFNVSKQAVNPGKGFGAYGLPKAATFFLLRQLALELGPAGVRVNGINADRIRSGLLDEDFVAERAKARGVTEETYMAGNLLRREVEARHVGEAFVALALSTRTTAHVMTVDGGNIEAALR